MAKKYALHIEYNSNEEGYIESFTEYMLTKTQTKKLMKEHEESVERDDEVDYVNFEIFELASNFNPDDNFDTELWDMNNTKVRSIKNL